MTESELIASARQGDMVSAHQLLSQYQAPLWGFLLSLLRHHADAEDALQETCLKALRGLANYRERGQFKSWLFQIAYRESLNVRRRQQRRLPETEKPEATDQLPDLAPLAAEQLESAEARARLQTCIDKLPEAEREVVLLRLQREIPFSEIAAITDTPLNTILSRMHKATHRLRVMMTSLPA
ncbi:MAG: RNA polymerase sigma factor [Verrucomicrobiota bacterium]